MQEVVDRVVHHLLLVGNRCQLHIFGNVPLEILQLLVNLRPHLRHVLSLLDLHRQKQALRTIVGDKRCLLGILTLHGSHILQPHVVTLPVRIDQRILHLIYFVEGMIYIDGRLIVIVLYATSRRHKALTPQRLRNRHVANTVVRQLVAVKIDADLVMLHSMDTHLTYAGNHAQRVDEGIHVVVQLAVGLVFRLHG